MNTALTILFFEDFFVCTIEPNESAWECLKVNGSEKLLLFFYVKNGVVSNDITAKERFEAGDSNAFGNIYETILNRNKTFVRFDLELEPIQLFKDVIDEIKAVYAERISTFITDFNINTDIPLNICFIPGISLEAQNIIINYLLNSGFKLNCKANYHESVINILQRKGLLPNKINISIAEAYFGDLYFHYIEYDKIVLKYESELLIGKGIDHRIGNLAKLMVEKVAQRCASSILNDKNLLEHEIKKFHPTASNEIGNFYYGELDIKIELSDYSSARIRVDQRDLEKMSAESFHFIKFKYEMFISRHSNLARTEKILLNGEVLGSKSFVQFFQNNFGTSKIILPFDNFIELLSRGVFIISPVTDVKNLAPSYPNTEIEITLTIIKDSQTPDYVLPKRPVLPENKLAIKPPIPEIKKYAKTEDKSIIRPPVPGHSNPTKDPNTSNAKPNPPTYTKPPIPEKPMLLLANFVGKEGIAHCDLRPTGKIEVASRLYEAIAQKSSILKGKKVKIVDLRNSTFTVIELISAPTLPEFKKKTNSSISIT